MKKTRRKKATKNFISRLEIAGLLALSASRVSQMVSEGILTQDTRGRHPRERTLIEIIGHLRKSADIGELKKEQLRRKNRLLAKAEARVEGELVSVDDAERGWTDRLLICRNRLLSIPGRFAPRAPYMKNENEVETELRREVEEALTELARPIDYDAEGADRTGE